MRFFKISLITLLLNILVSLPCFCLELSLGNDEQSLGIKISHEVNEPLGKPLPWGPASIRFVNSDIWIADTLKSRIAIFDNKGNYKSSIPISLPKDSEIGDFCVGHYGRDKKETLFILDSNNPILYIYNLEGKKILQYGTRNKSIFFYPTKIEKYDNSLFVLDSGKNIIYVFNVLGSVLSPKARLPINSNHFSVEEDTLAYFVNKDKSKTLKRKKINSEKVYNIKLKSVENMEFDYICYNNNKLYLGIVNDINDSENAQYQLLQIDEKGKVIKLNTDYPVNFLVRSFIKDEKGKVYQIKFNSNQPNKLIIDSLPEDFGVSGG